MDIDGMKFDLITQRFLVHRWETRKGRELRAQIAEAIKTGRDLGTLLGAHVLKHAENLEPHRFPHYPEDAMRESDFWLLTPEDLRGIRFDEENFSNTNGFGGMSLNYAQFTNCRFDKADLHRSDLSYASFENCSLNRVMMAHSGGVGVRIVSSDLGSSCLFDCVFLESSFCGTDCRGIYLEDALFQDLKVDYLTRFDRRLERSWKDRQLPLEQVPDLYRAIRIAYQKADLSYIADVFLFSERRAHRRYVIWPMAKRNGDYLLWLKDFIWSMVGGYGTQPSRLILLGLVTSVIYAQIYFFLGGPAESGAATSGYLGALYFSLTTFATLGYGDLAYSIEHPYLRLLSTSEAWLGAIVIALFVATMARKMLR